jgi:hypothetical protein
MKYAQFARRPLHIAALAIFAAIAPTNTQANAQATQHYPPSPRARYAWRPVTTTYAPNAPVQPAAYTTPIEPPLGVMPVTTYQPAPAPALAAMPAASGCCGQSCAPAVCSPADYAPATYPESTYVSGAAGVKTYRPLIDLTPPPPTYTVGRGLWGQSKVYVPYQPIRNSIRYLTP